MDVSARARSRARGPRDGLDFRAEDGWHSPSYGVRVPTTFLRAPLGASRPGRAGLVLRALS